MKWVSKLGKAKSDREEWEKITVGLSHKIWCINTNIRNIETDIDHKNEEHNKRNK